MEELAHYCTLEGLDANKATKSFNAAKKDAEKLGKTLDTIKTLDSINRRVQGLLH